MTNKQKRQVISVLVDKINLLYREAYYVDEPMAFHIEAAELSDIARGLFWELPEEERKESFSDALS